MNILCKLNVTKCAFVSFLLALSSCSSYDLGSRSPIAINVNTESPTWENGIQELIARKCDDCHAKQPSKFVPGEIRDDRARYSVGFSETEDGFLNYGSLSYQRVFNDAAKPMPPKYGTPLTEAEKLALKKYLEDKVINVADDETAFAQEACNGIAANTFNFAADVETVYRTQCAACHASATGVGGLDLSVAAQWKQEKNTLIYTLQTTTAGKKMPPGRADTYTDAGNPGEVLLNYLCASEEVNQQ